MKIATLVMVLLANHGYWFGGREQNMTVRWAARGELPGVDLSWQLLLDGARFAHGVVSLKANDEQATIRIAAPAVRVRTTFRWIYRIQDPATGKQLETAEIPIHVYPDTLLEGVGDRIGNKSLYVWDSPEQLPGLLARAKVPFSRIDDSAKLQVPRPDLLLVGRDMIDSGTFAQEGLIEQSRSGCGVMIFAQSRPHRLVSYPLVRRPAPAKLQWRKDHPLLADLTTQDLESELQDATDALAVRLPQDEPALEIAWWPDELAMLPAAPIDALLLSKTTGKGRLVLCQIPFGNWDNDPRSQILLRNSIDYLLTRARSTPPPGQRPPEILPPAPPDRVIRLSPGTEP